MNTTQWTERAQALFAKAGPADCLSCKGTGKASYNDAYRCGSCGGNVSFPVPDLATLVNGSLVTRGQRKGALKRSAPMRTAGPWAYDLETDRIRYVWRMMRFHAGVDVTMPMTFDLALRGDPFKRDLDTFARMYARLVTGRDSAGQRRWETAITGGGSGDSLSIAMEGAANSGRDFR